MKAPSPGLNAPSAAAPTCVAMSVPASTLGELKRCPNFEKKLISDSPLLLFAALGVIKAVAHRFELEAQLGDGLVIGPDQVFVLFEPLFEAGSEGVALAGQIGDVL